MISSIISCLRVFALWAVVAVFIWIPYAISQHNLRFPNRIVNSFNKIYSWNETTEGWNKTGDAYSYKAMTLRKLLRDAFFNMFGELFFDQFDPGTAWQVFACYQHFYRKLLITDFYQRDKLQVILKMLIKLGLAVKLSAKTTKLQHLAPTM